ncbi:hypothetical protein GQ55_6G196700 [Panicum hallii var. hallii]|uniref:Uncharacterized protein n=1 Tax=Panicum hallii var. hallii TaxID=1504633 RepID=A0A2T7D7I9_9POAL|nr:hypothetical protein GQ55_6G196700 [Panicum hallii var. hallii]
MSEAGAQPLPVRGARGRGSQSRRGDIPHRPRTPNPPPTAAHPTDALVPPPPRVRVPAAAATRHALREGCRRGPLLEAWRRAIGPLTAALRSRPAIKTLPPRRCALSTPAPQQSGVPRPHRLAALERPPPPRQE